MNKEDIKYYNEKFATDSKVVLASEEAIKFIKAYMKELIDRENYDIEDVKDDMIELAGYIRDISDSEAEFVAIKECAMSGTNICVVPLMPTMVREYLMEQVAVWCLNSCDIASDEDIPVMFNTKDQIIFKNIIHKLQKA